MEGRPHEREESASRGRVAGVSVGAAILPWLLSMLLSTLLFGGTSRGAEEPGRGDGESRSAAWYVEKALSGNPSLAAMAERIRVKENAAVRAGALDDPKVWFGVSGVPVPSWDFEMEEMTGKEVGFSQMFPWPGMLRSRREAVLREKEEAEHSLEEMRSMLRAEVKMAFAELASVRKQAEVVRHSRGVLEEIVASTRERYAVGRGSQPDVLRGQVEFERMREMLLMLANRERILSIRLNTLAALPPDAPVPPIPDLAEFPVAYREADLLAGYREFRAARKAAESRVQRGDAQVEMAELKFYPELEFSVSYMQRDDRPDGTRRDDMVSSMVMLSLPIWRSGKLEPELREMKAEREMAAREVDTLDNEAGYRIGSALASLRNRAETAALYRTTLIPQAEQSFLASGESYRVGKTDFPMLMDSLMALLSFRREHAAAVGEMHAEKARLEQAVGRDLP